MYAVWHSSLCHLQPASMAPDDFTQSIRVIDWTCKILRALLQRSESPLAISIKPARQRQQRWIAGQNNRLLQEVWITCSKGSMYQLLVQRGCPHTGCNFRSSSLGSREKVRSASDRRGVPLHPSLYCWQPDIQQLDGNVPRPRAPRYAAWYGRWLGV